MLSFSKGFKKQNNSKIVTDYVIKTDLDRIEEIRDRMNPNPIVSNNQVSNNNSQNGFDQRIKAIKNIKKD